MTSFGSESNPFGDPRGGDAANSGSTLIRNKKPFDDDKPVYSLASPNKAQPGATRTGGYGTTSMPPSGASTPIGGFNNAPATLLPSSGASTPNDNNSASTTPWYGDTTVNIAAGRMPSEELERRQRELDGRAAELDRRERALASGNVRMHNWPPLPSWSPFGPCFYQDIEVEIPVEFQRTTRFAYLTWLAYAFTLLINFIVQIARLVVMWSLIDFIMSIIWTVIFIPLSYTAWFRPIYKAFRADSSFNFFIFFFVFFAQILVAIFQCFGIGLSGFAGWWIVRDAYTANPIVGILCTVSAVLFTLLAVTNLVVMHRVHRIYQGSSASWQKAQSEFSGNMMRNQHVQQAAAGVARSAVSNAFSGGGAGGGQPQRF